MSKKGFTYTLQIDAEINDLIAKTAQVKKSMQSIMDAGKAPGAEKVFTSIEKAIERLQTKASQPIESVAVFQNLQKDAAAVGVSLGKLGTIIENLGNMGVADKLDLLPPDLKKQIEDASSALLAFSKATAQAEQKTQDLVDAENQLVTAQKELKKAEGRVQDKKALVAAQQQLVNAAHAEANAIKAKIEALKKYQATAAAYEAAGGNKSAKGDSKANAGKGLEGLNLPGDRKAAVAAVPGLNPSDTQAVTDAIARLNDEYRQASKTITDTEATQRRYNSQLNDANNAASVTSGKVATLTSTVARLNTEFEKDKTKNVQAAYAQLRNEAGRLGVNLSKIPLDYTEQNFNELNTAMNQLVASGISQVDTGLNTIQSEMSETAISVQNLGDHMNVASEEVVKLDEAVSNTMAFTERIKQFVGLQGGIQLARTAMRNAISTIKELDKAMTEMAVVTEFEVGDYWDQLPEYTARANALGVSIKGAYESATLYYQQGLKTNEVVAMSNQTLKMARIAGLSAEDATNKMTAALRGFNMELNETSAQRVADVYSELAAITASDVDEISSAMTKTASIASSAGMEFETTAAFLSQIIETTRESAETAGTALKTVIARFQELKKDPSEIGEVDGEIVDANKIETALRTVGVSLRDTSGQFRELDDVFLELSSKWDSLDTNTQRYIATIAAGSRQQSRFIAMMSDYNRTQELVAAANSSAGASNEQFEKTMDSLESKLNELKNAWDSFTMGIMNSDVLKIGIDLLTGILTAINNITDAFGDFGGAAKIGLLVAALYLGDKALKVFMGSLQGCGSVFGAFGATGRAALDSINKRFVSLKKLFSAKLNIKIGSEELSSATLASKEYQRATEELKKVELERAAAAKAGELSYEKSAMYSQQATEATVRQSAAEKELMATMGLSVTQLEAVSALEALNVATGDALILTKAGISAATLAEISAINKKTVAENASTLAQNLSNASGIRAISAKIGLTVANWAQTASENAKTGSLWASVTATIAQTMANWGLQASMWPILVVGLLVVAAFAALVAIIWLLIKAFKAWKANSPEGRLKAAEKASKSAAEAAEVAADAYNNLADSLQNVADKYTALENITHGTEEWRKATKAVNDEVLNLIDRYPELAQYVESINGVLTLDLDSQEVAGVLQKYEKQMSASSNAALNSRIKELEAALNVTASNLQEKSTKYETYDAGGTYDNYGNYYPNYQTLEFSLSQSLIKQLATAVAKGEVYDKDGSGSLKEELEEWIGARSNLGYEDYFASTLNSNIETLKEFGNEIYRATEEIQLYTEQMAQSAISSLDQSKFTEQELTQMRVAGTSDFTQQYIEQRLSEYDAEEDKKFNDKKMSQLKEEVAKTFGNNATVSGNTITYYDNEGNAQTQELTNEEFKSRWAAIKATQDMTEAFELLPKTINKISAQMSSEAGKAFKAMYAGKEGSAMTKADIESQTYTKEELNAIWGNLSVEEQKAYGTFENLWKQYSDSQEAGVKALEQATEVAHAAGIEVIDGVTMEAARGYSKQMRHLYITSGEAMSDSIDTMVNSLISGLDDTDKTAFLSALNALDWTNLDSLEMLPDTLTQIGITVPQDELQTFVAELGKTAGALRTIDLNKVKESSTTLTNLLNSIKSGEQGRSFSEESYKALTEMAPELAKEFSLSIDGSYTYLGSSMDKLRLAIEDNTAALLQNAVEQLNDKIGMAQIAQQQTKNSLSFAQLSRGQGSEQHMRDQLNTYIANANAAGIDIIGINNLSNKMTKEDVAKLTINEMKQIFADLAEVQADEVKNREAYATTAVEAAMTTYQGKTMSENAYNIGMTKGYANESFEKRQEFDARSATLMMQAVQSGVNSQLVDQYAEIVNQFKEGEASYRQVLEIQNKLANVGSYNIMKESLQDWVENIAEVSEKYEKLSDGDLLGKLNLVNGALAKFGIEIENAADADMYMDLLEQISQGSTTALATLVGVAQEAADLPKELGNAYTTTWTNLSTEQVAFFDKMEEAGLGYWSEMGDKGEQFVWATSDILNSVAEEAGTAAEKWENPYSWLYNYNEEINRVIKDRENIERAYTRALEDEGSTAEELLEFSAQQLANLEEEAALRKQSASNAVSAIEAQFAANEKYAKYVGFDPKTGAITVDFEGLNTAGFTEDEGAEFEEFVAAIEENRDELIESQKTLEDIQDQVDEIKERGKEETSDLYNKIKEGLVQSRQQEIDALQNINDSIEEAQSALVDQMQQQIEEARQARDNEKTENNIADKETRLAYLMRDTSGGNAMEIAKLQEEIASEKEGYTDSLVDQQLQSLQDANEKAAEQRQQQIDLAQAQLDAYANSQQVWMDVEGILENSLIEAKSSGDFAKNWLSTEAGKLITQAENFESLNPIEKALTEENSIQNAKLASIYTGVTTMDTDINQSLAESATITQGKIEAAKNSIDLITTNAKTFGSISNENLTTAIGKITGGGEGATLGGVISSVKNSGTTTAAAVQGTKKKTISDVFGSLTDIFGITQALSDTGSSLNELDDRQAAVQKGISAMTSFTSGGGDFKESNAAYTKAREEYVKAGGTAQEFDQAVTNAIKNNEAGFDYGAHYDSSSKKIVTGTFPNTKVEGLGGGWGAYDQATFTFADGAKATVEVPIDKNVVNDQIANEINKMYAGEGLNPADGWIVLYKDNPYVYNTGAWRYFDDTDNSKNKIKEIMSKNLNPHFKTGGLADFTGPAWLDGTKSKPEIVLNQTDSANFMQLRDILADILQGTSSISNTNEKNRGGDNYYDIEINVESISDDYDVEQLADKIKSMIYEDSTYRNVNSISGLR